MHPCLICAEALLKYKCPTCSIPYCLVSCYKDPRHVHSDREGDKEFDHKEVDYKEGDKEFDYKEGGSHSGDKEDGSHSDKEGDSHRDELPTPTPASPWERIARDPIIQQMLSAPSLQLHLHVVTQILVNASLSNATNSLDRKQVAKLKLCDLRAGGIEQNAQVEEFAQRVLLLSQS